MPAGPWLNGPSGRPLAGALGVLIDNVAGYVFVLQQPPGRWSVSAEITLDLLRPVPADGSVLTAEGIVRHVGQAGGFSSASVTDGSGQLLAVATQHGRWVRAAPAADGGVPAGNGTAPAADIPLAADLDRFLGGQVRAADGGALLELTVTPGLTNPLGNMHGGITLCACDLVAQAAIDAAGGGGRRGRRPSMWPTRAPSRPERGYGSRPRWRTWAGPSVSSGSPRSTTAAGPARSPP
jgi:acyl-coenzyme A thioesterase PaaI-like protein